MPISTTHNRRRSRRVKRSMRGGVLIFSVAIMMGICLLALVAALFVANIAVQAYYNDKARTLAYNTYVCYTKEITFYGVPTGVPPAVAGAQVQSELNDAMNIMGMPNGTFTFSTSATQQTSQVSVIGLSSVGSCGIFPTFLNTNEAYSGNIQVPGKVRQAIIIPTASGNFQTPAFGTFGSSIVRPVLPAYVNPLEGGTYCQANLFNFNVPIDEFDLTFSQYYHQCPGSVAGCCPSAPKCNFLTCGGTHPGPPPIPASAPIPFEKCENIP